MIAFEVRKAGYEPALVGYTTTTPDPRVNPAEDPRFKVLGRRHGGLASVGLGGACIRKPTLPGWRRRATRCRTNPLTSGCRAMRWRENAGPPHRPAASPAALSDTRWFTDRGLEYLRGTENKPWFLHLGYWRPHPPHRARGLSRPL